MAQEPRVQLDVADTGSAGPEPGVTRSMLGSALPCLQAWAQRKPVRVPPKPPCPMEDTELIQRSDAGLNEIRQARSGPSTLARMDCASAECLLHALHTACSGPALETPLLTISGGHFSQPGTGLSSITFPRILRPAPVGKPRQGGLGCRKESRRGTHCPPCVAGCRAAAATPW